MPEVDLIQFVNKRPPDLLCISATVVESPRDLVGFVERVRDQIPDSVEMVIGGPAVPEGLRVDGVQVNPALALV